MRPPRLLLPLTATVALGLCSPAIAADVLVDVVDDDQDRFFFGPKRQQVDVGDTVVWTFNAGNGFDHSATSDPGGREWDSGIRGPSAEPYRHTFAKPGRYSYVCTPHSSFMKGSITVGNDAESDTIDSFKGTRRGNNLKVSFKLNEPAKVTYKLNGRSGRTVKRGRLKAGRHSFRLRNLKEDEYRGTLTAVDDFDKQATAKNHFVVP